MTSNPIHTNPDSAPGDARGPATLNIDALTGHTPGPWAYADSDLTPGRFSIYANGPLAYCEGHNAPLLAAAPSLLEECRRLRTESARLRALAVAVINADRDNSPRVPAPVMRDVLTSLALNARAALDQTGAGA